MALHSVKEVPPDLEVCRENYPQAGQVSGQAPYPPAGFSGHHVMHGAAAPAPSLSVPEKFMWVDLWDPEHSQLESACQAFPSPAAVLAFCRRRFHTPAISCIDSTLFLETFFAGLSPGRLCSLQELKVCVTPRVLLTVRRHAGTTPYGRQFPLPEWKVARDDHAGALLCLILAGAVRSYEAVGAALKQQLTQSRGRARVPAGEGEGQFVQFLRHQRSFLRRVKDVGRAFFGADECTRLQWLGERVGVMARILEEGVRMFQDTGGYIEQELKVILTEREKRGALIGGRFAFRRFTAVDLSGAVFRGADLQGARFVRSNLRGADFRQANLQGTVFSRCDLEGADFADARLEGAAVRMSSGLSLAAGEYIRSRGGSVEEKEERGLSPRGGE